MNKYMESWMHVRQQMGHDRRIVVEVERDHGNGRDHEWMAIVSGVKDCPMYFYGATPTLALMKATLNMMENE